MPLAGWRTHFARACAVASGGHCRVTVDEPALSCFGGQRTVSSNGGLWEPAHFFFLPCFECHNTLAILFFQPFYLSGLYHASRVLRACVYVCVPVEKSGWHKRSSGSSAALYMTFGIGWP